MGVVVGLVLLTVIDVVVVTVALVEVSHNVACHKSNSRRAN